MFAGALLGAVFGLMGSVASLMDAVEGFTDKAANMYLQKKRVKYLKCSRKKISTYFHPKIIETAQDKPDFVQSFSFKEPKNKIKSYNEVENF